ncbi:hypothetical protein FOZ61_007913 [Perkinsus olseni]|uniref:Membrane transport protein MMPL domain-containing protein n=2 Tax=Perkinsus olseni TaxID=32597 RepID=A0A7J6MH87_PEROL|nr:hypothetical protein FOZ61_007913 [Perkinsus olseni]
MLRPLAEGAVAPRFPMRSARCRISFPTLRKCGEVYVDLLRRLRYFLLPFWLVLLGGCIVGTLHIYDNIDNGVDPPEDSPSAQAYRAMVQLYGGEQEFTPEVLLVELPADAKGDLFTDGLIDDVTKTVEDHWKDWPDVEIQGYVSAQVLPGVATFFMSKSNRSSIITVIFPPDWSIDDVYEQEQDVVDLLDRRFSSVGLVAHFSGPRAFLKEAPMILERDLLLIHIFVLPLAFAVLAFALRSWRLLLLPLCTLVMALTICATTLYIISLLLRTTSASPIMMAAIVLALSIDYSLILLTRFREELLVRKKGVRDACIDMLCSSGIIIVSSGGVLFSCFSWILLIPSFTSVALAFMVSVFCSLSLNLTVIPTFIITFPNFFANFANCPSCCCGRRVSGDRKRCCNFDPPLWFRWGRMVTNRWAFVPSLIAAMALAAFFGWSSAHLQLTGDISHYDPRGSSLARVSTVISQDFPPGITGPYVLILESSTSAPVLSEPYWSVAQGVCQTIATQLLADQEYGSLVGPLYTKVSGQTPLSPPLPLVEQLLDPSCTSPICLAYQSAFDKSESPDGSALMVTLISDQRPTSHNASVFLARLRDLVAQLNEVHGGTVRVWITGISALVGDVNAAVVSSIPQFTAASAATCLLVIGLAYRSVMIPLRSIFTIALTVIVAFGMLVGSHQLGWFKFLHPEPISPAVSTDISWMVATLGFSVILGLALDYDIFLLGRVVEEHDNGLSDQAAIHVGVWKTGPVITMAGVIMTVAFSGLFFSSVPLINQAGVLVVTAVVFDTFVMRTIITPSLLRVIGRLNWWPKRCPPVTCTDAKLILDRDQGIDKVGDDHYGKESPKT